MKKLVCLLLSTAMLFSFAACGNGNNGGGNDGGIKYPDFANTPAEKDSWEYNNEEITIDWYVDNSTFQYSTYGSDKVSKVIKEKTGVNIRFTSPVDDSGQFLSNLISTNSLPDVITVAAYTSVKDRISSQGYIYPIDELAKRWAPSLTNRIEKDIHAYYELSDGMIYGLPACTYPEEYYADEAYAPNGGFLVRKDLYEWYVNKYPTADVMSKEGFYTMVKTVVQTFGYTGLQKPAAIDGIEPIRNMNGILLDPFTSEGNKSVTWISQYFAAPFEDAEGNFVDTRTTPQFKESLEFLNRAYNDGLITESNLDYNPSEVGGRIANGSAFCTMVTAQDYASYFNAAWNKGAGFEYIPIIFTNAAGDDPILQDLTGYGYMYSMITTNAKRPDIIIKLFDFLWSKEGQILCSLGIEGETYTYADETKTSYVFTQTYIDQKKSGVLYDNYGVERMWLFSKTNFVDSITPTNAYTKDHLYAKNIKRPLTAISYMYGVASPPLNTTSSEYNTIINKQYSVDMIWAENLTSIISAKPSDFNATFEGTLSDMRTRGLEDVVNFYRPAYKAFLAKLGYDRGWPAYRANFVSKIKDANGNYIISPNGDSSYYIIVDTID